MTEVPHAGGGKQLGVLVVAHQQDYLRECLASVQSQTVEPSQVVLVDNGSPESACASDIAREMEVDYIRLSVPRSLAAARNIACEFLHRCDYVVALDGDDLLEPRYVEVVWREATNRGADVVYGPAELFGTMTGVAFLPSVDFKEQDLRWGNFIPAMALFTHEIWRKAGGYDPLLAYYEDWDFWLSCAENGAKFHAVDEVLWRYRRHPRSMLATAQDEEKADSRRRVRSNHLKYIWGPFQWRRVRRNIQKLAGQE